MGLRTTLQRIFGAKYFAGKVTFENDVRFKRGATFERGLDDLSDYEPKWRLFPTGSADEQTYINAAIVAAAAEGGGTVHLVAGTWNINGTIDISYDNIVLEGEGAATKIVDGGTEACITVGGLVGAHINHVAIRNIQFYSTQTSGNRRFISVTYCDDYLIEGCRFSPVITTNGVVSIVFLSLNDGTSGMVSDNYFTCTNTGSQIITRIIDANAAVNETSITGNLFENLYFSYTNGSLIALERKITFSNNVIRNVTSTKAAEDLFCIGIGSMGGGQNKIQGNYITSLTASGNSYAILLLASSFNTVCNNYITLSDKYAIYVYQASCGSNAILDNYCYNNGSDTGIANTGGNFTDGGTSTQTWGNSWQGTGGSTWSFPSITLTGMTSGSVLFAGAGGLVSQDNAALFWDAGGKFLRLNDGTSSAGSWIALKLQKGVGYGETYFIQQYTSVSDYGLRIGDSVGNYLSINYANGNVGIGTASPGYTLEVNGNAKANNFIIPTIGGALTTLDDYNTVYLDGTNDYIMFRTNNVADRMRITSTGNVGIGTASPGVLLHSSGASVSGAVATKIENTNSNAASLATMQMKTGASASVWQMFARNGDAFIGIESVADYVTFKSGGNVGIGMTPTEVLSVNGNAWLSTDAQLLLLGTGKDMSVQYTGTYGRIDTSLIAASDLQIDCGTDKTIVLDETVWDDLQFPVSSGKVPASNYPNWELMNGLTYNYEFAFAVDEYIQLSANEPFHGWKQGTAGSLHVHFAIRSTNAAATRYVKLRAYLAYADVNEVWVENAAVDATATIAASAPALTHYLLTMGDVSLTNVLIGSQIKIRIGRIGVESGEYADDVYITQVGIHLEHDTIGSRTVNAK